MNDDWRLRIEFPSRIEADKLAVVLAQGEVEHALDDGFADRVVVSLDSGDHEVFAYAATREQAEKAKAAIERVLSQQGWQATPELKRWHPVAEEWEDPDVPLPTDEAGRAAEHAELIAQEQREAVTNPQWEVRVTCKSHQDALALAEQLQAQGTPFVRRWRYVVVAAADEDSARSLADRLKVQAPPDAQTSVELTRPALEETLPSNPFRVFGGLGG
jgi:hypothetical protein